jgi:hypothetical protein
MPVLSTELWLARGSCSQVAEAAKERVGELLVVLPLRSAPGP